MSRSVCLVNPPDTVVEDTQWDEPLGLLYLAAALESKNISVKVVDLNFHKGLSILDNIKADWFGLYCSSSIVESTLRVNTHIRLTHPKAKTMVGGPHATCAPQSLKPFFDRVIVGEGEEAIVRALDKNSPTIVTCPPIEDLDDIPFPARHLLPIKEYHRRVGGEISVGLMTTRGCPANCAFCSKVWGKGIRFRSAENVLQEVKECIDKYGIHALNIRDDTFTLSRPRLYKLLDGFKELGVVWRCLTRVDQVSREVLMKMKDSGCTQIVYGLESGNQNILNSLGKGTTVEQNIEAVKLTKEAGIEVKAAVIIGNPGETKETAMDTVSMIEKTMPDKVILCTFTPYPGSPVWDNPEKFKMKILSRDVSKYVVVGEDMTGNVVIETEKMSAQDIVDTHKVMLNRFKELKLI